MNRGEIQKPKTWRLNMLSKLNALGVITLVFFCLFVLLFVGSVVHADGSQGQWPVSDPPPDESGSGGDGEGDNSDGIMALITIDTMLQVIL
jgi:hypothetical protein